MGVFEDDHVLNIVKALRIVISSCSELNELWQESKDYDDWKPNILEIVNSLYD